MSWVKTIRRALNEAVDSGLSYLPPETVAHLGRASTELLLAARAVIDEQIYWNGRHVERAAAIRVSRRAAVPADEARGRRGRPAGTLATGPDLATEDASRPD